MKRLAGTLAVLAMVVGLLALLAFDGPPPRDDTPTALVRSGRLESVLHLRGELDAGAAMTIASTIAGDRGVLIWMIDEGKSVEPGDMLAVLDPAPFEARARELEDLLRQREADDRARAHATTLERQQAEQAIENAHLESELAELEHNLLLRGTGPEEVGRLQRELSIAQRESDRFSSFLEDLSTLIDRGALSEPEVRRTRAEAEQARWEADAAARALDQYRDMVLPALDRKAQVRVARARAALAETQRMAEAIQARMRDEAAAAHTARQRAERDAAQARGDLERASIRATMPGMVVHAVEYRGGERRAPRVGDRVFQGQPLLHLPDLGTMIMRSRVREVDLHKLAPGTLAQVGIDAFPAVRLDATVSSIGVLASPRDEDAPHAGRTFAVTLAIEATDDRLRPGMTARAVIGRHDEVPLPLVPRQAVFEADGDAFCYVRLESGEYERRPVRIHALGDFDAAIAQGLDVGERVALVDPSRRDEN